MDTDFINSRKNSFVRHFKNLGTEKAYRQEQGEFLAVGRKLLTEALAADIVVCALLYSGTEKPQGLSDKVVVHETTKDIISYISGMKSAPDLVFSCKLPITLPELNAGRYIVLENIQDPGNTGTILRSSLAFETDGIILLGDCADPYSLKAVRASMGAVFKTKILECTYEVFFKALDKTGMPLYAAALTDDAISVDSLRFPPALAVAVGNEGSGISTELLEKSTVILRIPMGTGSESLNAAVAASVLMWEIYRGGCDASAR